MNDRISRFIYVNQPACTTLVTVGTNCLVWVLVILTRTSRPKPWKIIGFIFQNASRLEIGDQPSEQR